MVNIITGFIDQVKRDIAEQDKTSNIEEIVQNISIMVTSGKQFIKELPDYQVILNDIEYLSQLNHKQYPSLSSKIVFKFMDLQEELDD